ncbi:MAG: hypothetical protein CL609_04215 [Anaerolineaceae bacterium]|nr:hypothetical protein [Anaerolineaceae bacterium]
MAENSVNPISSIDSESGVSRVLQMAQQHAEIEAARSVEQSKAVKPTSEDKPAPSPVKSVGDIQLKFQVNEETKQVTVYVVDRESKRVIRSIPPDELNNLQAGDLVELLA